MNIFVYPDNMEYVSVHSQRETDREMSQKEREREVEREGRASNFETLCTKGGRTAKRHQEGQDDTEHEDKK